MYDVFRNNTLKYNEQRKHNYTDLNFDGIILKDLYFSKLFLIKFIHVQ